MRIAKVSTQSRIGLIFVQLDYHSEYNTPWSVISSGPTVDEAIDNAIAMAVATLLNTRYSNIG